MVSAAEDRRISGSKLQHFQQVRTFLENNKTSDNKLFRSNETKQSAKSNMNDIHVHGLSYLKPILELQSWTE